MTKPIGIILIVAGLFLGYVGLQQFQKSTNSAEILGVELKVNDQGGQQTGIIQLALAVGLFVGGLYVFKKS